MSSLNPSSPIWQVQLARMLIPHTLTSRSHVSLAVLIPQKSLSQKSKHCLWQQPHIFLLSLRMNPLLPEPFPSSIGRRRKPPLPSLLCTLDCSRSPLGVLLMHTWMSKSLKGHMSLVSLYATFWIQTPAKNKPVAAVLVSRWVLSSPAEEQSQNTVACCFLLALMLGSGPAGSEIYLVCSLSLAISAMYQFCKFSSEGRGTFLLLPENRSSCPSWSWECPSTFIQV